MESFFEEFRCPPTIMRKMPFNPSSSLLYPKSIDIASFLWLQVENAGLNDGLSRSDRKLEASIVHVAISECLKRIVLGFGEPSLWKQMVWSSDSELSLHHCGFQAKLCQRC